MLLCALGIKRLRQWDGNSGGACAVRNRSHSRLNLVKWSVADCEVIAMGLDAQSLLWICSRLWVAFFIAVEDDRLLIT